MSSALTENRISRIPAAPKGERKEYTDSRCPGLVLRVDDQRRKYFFVNYRFEGRNKKLGLGKWDSVSLEEARNRTRWARDQVAQGIDPREFLDQQKIANKLKEMVQAELKMWVIVKEYLRAAKEGKLTGGRRTQVTKGTIKARASRMRRFLLPNLGKYQLSEIEPLMVGMYLNDIEENEGPVDRCLQDLRLIYSFARSRGMFSGVSPSDGIQKRQSQQVSAKAFSDNELKAMWRAANDIGYPFGPAIKLLMLTGQRRSEISNLRWSEINMNSRLIVVPRSKIKNRKGDHEIPLSQAAIEILDGAREACKVESKFVFTTTGASPVSGWSRAKLTMDRQMRAVMAGVNDSNRFLLRSKSSTKAAARKRKDLEPTLSKVDLSYWRFHDLRHTLVTRLSDGEMDIDGISDFAFPVDVVQQVVNHELTMGITGRYDHGNIEKRYRKRKRDALNWWGDELLRIVGQQPGVRLLPSPDI